MSSKTLLACAASLIAGVAAQADVVATFELRAPGGAPSVTIEPGQMAALEVWLTLTGDSIPAVRGASFYLDLDAATENNVISYSNWTIAPQWAFGPATGAANSPVSGTFAAGVSASFPSTVTFLDGVGQKLGSFDVTGISAGTAAYEFTSRGTSDKLQVNFATTTSVSYAQGPQLPITVTPEPATAALIGLGLLAVRRKRR